MFCSNCGKENLEDSAFCYDCGSPLKNNEANVEPVKKIEFGEIKNQNEIKCPFCGNNNVERVNRIGCLGETVLGLIFNMFSVIVNWTKPKWTWDMEFKDCQKNSCGIHQ